MKATTILFGLALIVAIIISTNAEPAPTAEPMAAPKAYFGVQYSKDRIYLHLLI